MPELAEVLVLQVEPQAAESDLQQDDVAALWLDGGLPAPGEDFHQQGVQLQRVPSQVCLQQGPLPELPGGRLEQEAVEADGQATPEAPEPHLLSGDAPHPEELEPATWNARAVASQREEQLGSELSGVPAACSDLHVGTRGDGRHTCGRLPDGVPGRDRDQEAGRHAGHLLRLERPLVPLRHE